MSCCFTQEHFKVQRRIEKKNIIQELWRLHNENWSQKEKFSQSKPWPQSHQGEGFEERKTSCCRALLCKKRGCWGALKPHTFRVEIKSERSGLDSVGWQFLHPHYMKDLFWHTFVSTGQGNWPATCWLGLASLRVLPSLWPLSRGGNHPVPPLWGWRHLLSPCNHLLWACTPGEKPTLLKGPWAGKLEELRIGSNPEAAQQTQPWGSQVQATTPGQIWRAILPSGALWQVVYFLTSCSWNKNTQRLCASFHEYQLSPWKFNWVAMPNPDPFALVEGVAKRPGINWLMSPCL